MTQAVRRLFAVFLAVALACASGCYGFSSNPSYFPHLVPFGDVVETHSKPVGPSYYENFDPHAIDLSVEPAIMTTHVGAQVVILATVRDGKGEPRRNRRVNWFLAGAGHLIEVDESGLFPGRGGNRGDYAFSYTNYGEHRLSRGNENKLDDVMLRPGQSWCVVSSPVEGDTHVQVVVPGINNWDKRVKTALIRWVDVTWEFPPRAAQKFGTEYEFITKIARHTDRLPLANYRVKYKILDGPPAMLMPSRAQEAVATSDLRGFASIKIAQLQPASGINRIGVEIVRPPDPTAPSGTGVPIASGETSVEWLAPDVKLSHVGPVSAPLGTNVQFTTSVTNTGRIESQWQVVKLPVPDGMDFVSSQPAAEANQGQIEIPFGTLGSGQTHTVQTTFRSKRAGPVRCLAVMQTAEGQTDQKEAGTRITTPALKLDLVNPPQTGLVDVPFTLVFRLSNPGDGDLDAIHLVADFDKGLDHDKPGTTLIMDVPGLKAGEQRDALLPLTPRQQGPLGVRITATSSGLTQQVTHTIMARRPNVSLRVEGPTKAYVSRPADWKIYVKNDGDTDLTGVVVRDRLPAEQAFVASQSGTHLNGEVTWNLGTLRSGQAVTLDLTTNCTRAAVASDKNAVLTADGGIRVEKTARLEILGIAALQMKMNILDQPVEVGKSAVYRLVITNTGSAPANGINVKAIVPNEMKATRATGPTRETILGQTVTFATVNNLQPGAALTFQFECEALKAGDVRFRTEYTSELNPTTPIFEEESTRIIMPFLPNAPIPKGPPAPPPPPPAGGVPMPLPPG